jgi:MFS transporter, FSR family, fosmidomycin resistance protein
MWTSLPWFIMAHFGHHLLTALPGPLLPAIRTEFNLSYTQSSFVTTAFALAGGGAQLPSGWLADRIKPAVLIAMGTLGVAVGGILVGISQTYIMLLVFLVVMGLMTGGYHPASTPLILSSVEPQQRGRALGFHLVGGNSSFFVAPLIAGPILAVWGWRAPFLVLAVPTAIFGLIFYIYLTQRGGKGHADAARQRVAAEKPPQPGYKRRLIAYLTMMVLGGGAGMSVNAFLTLYMVDKLGASDAKAAMLMSILYLPGIFGAPVIGGWISDRIGSVKVIIATSIISGLIIFGVKSFSLGFGFYAMLFIMGVNMAIRMPVTEVFIMSQTPANRRSTIYGIYYFTMQYTGAIFAPIMGWFIQKYTFSTMFTFSAYAVTAISIGTSFFIWDAKDNYSSEPPAVPPPGEEMAREAEEIKKVRDQVRDSKRKR